MSGSLPPIPPALPPPVQLIAIWQQQLRDAYAARHKLLIQQMPSAVLYTAGDGGSKSVTFSRTSIGALNEYIADLERKLGMRRRRALRAVF